MNSIKVNEVLDAKGLACPMPIVKTKKVMNTLEPGQVLEVLATDKGSKADLKAWAESTGHQYLGSIEQEGVLQHYLRKSSGEEAVERKHPNVLENDALEQKLQSGDDFIVLDVREEAEYAFEHIPNALSIPFGELNSRLAELDKEKEIYVVCRTGSRSDMAAQKLTSNGFYNVYNVVPGMSQWNGNVSSLTN